VARKIVHAVQAQHLDALGIATRERFREWGCISAAVNRSMTFMGPAHWGQSQRSHGAGAEIWGCAAAAEPSDGKQSGKVVARRRLARKPKWRMRTKPLGSTCNKKRRRNSSSDRVSNFCSLWCAESRQRKVTFPPSKRDQTMVGDGDAMGVAAQILEYMFWTSEGRFAVDHPILSE
jgi:hypothetical protein